MSWQGQLLSGIMFWMIQQLTAKRMGAHENQCPRWHQTDSNTGQAITFLQWQTTQPILHWGRTFLVSSVVTFFLAQTQDFPYAASSTSSSSECRGLTPFMAAFELKHMTSCNDVGLWGSLLNYNLSAMIYCLVWLSWKIFSLLDTYCGLYIWLGSKLFCPSG